MSLAIDIDTVVKVCVAGKWHDVAPWYEKAKIFSSFYIDAYEYISRLDTQSLMNALTQAQQPEPIEAEFTEILPEE